MQFFEKQLFLARFGPFRKFLMSYGTGDGGARDLAELFGALARVVRLGVTGSTTAFGAVRSRFESWGRSCKRGEDSPLLQTPLSRSAIGPRPISFSFCLNKLEST